MSRPERKSEFSPRPLAPVALELKWERFSAVAKELPPLFRRHYQEIAANHKVLLDPDWDAYYQMDLANRIRVLTARSGGVLVGYVFVIAGPHLHYVSTLWAHIDLYWLDPVYRQGWTGYRMLREVVRHMRENGVKVLMAPEKLHFERKRGGTGILWKRLGFKPQDRLWSLYLE